MFTPSGVCKYRMRGSVMPPHLVQANRLLEALERGLTLVSESEALASRELLYHISHEYLPRLSLVTDPRRQLYGGSEQVLILSDRLTSVQPDADTEGSVRVGLIVVGLTPSGSPQQL